MDSECISHIHFFWTTFKNDPMKIQHPVQTTNAQRCHFPPPVLSLPSSTSFSKIQPKVKFSYKLCNAWNLKKGKPSILTQQCYHAWLPLCIILSAFCSSHGTVATFFQLMRFYYLCLHLHHGSPFAVPLLLIKAVKSPNTQYTTRWYFRTEVSVLKLKQDSIPHFSFAEL